MYREVYISPQKGDVYRITKPLHYKDIVVPSGYTTNGADVPRLFWSFFPPNRSDYLPAVIVHDYLCDQGEYQLGVVSRAMLNGLMVLIAFIAAFFSIAAKKG